MEYYILKCSIESKIIGVYPQVVFNNPKGLNPNPCLVANMTDVGEYPPDDILPFDYLELNKRARLTDLMNSDLDYNGFVISKKLKTLFEEFNVRDYRYYEIHLFNKNEEIKDYYYFHSASLMRKYIDFSNSSFCVKNSAGAFKFNVPNYNSYEELKQYKESLNQSELISATSFYLKSTFPFQQNLFKMGTFNYDFFITKKLKEAIEFHKVTGVHTIPVKDLIKTPNLS